MATVTEVVRTYIKIRNTLDEERAKFKEVEKKLKGDLERLAMWLRDNADKQGVDSFRTPDGTAYRVVKESFRVGDWTQILKFIQETGNWQMLEKRIGKLATKEIYEELGELPPGVDYHMEVDFQVRRPTKQK